MRAAIVRSLRMTVMRVLAAMSGGVDSAVATARAVDAGHDVTGVHLALSKNPRSSRSGARGCCSAEDAHDARRAADVLGIPFYVWDLSDRFAEDVVEDFVAEYAAGRTPNPCLRCNEKIKFAAVLDRGLALGFDAVCTGHYARLTTDGDEISLRRARDAAKDQSYVLAVLNPHQLEHSLFPLGEDLKSAVRADADRRGLSVADKPDSHDICFIPDGDTAGFLDARLGNAEGAIVDTAGNELGRHTGSHHFTIGQRKGLRVGTPADDGRPRYVLDISPVTNTVTVGPAAALGVDQILTLRPTWTGREDQLADHHLTVQVRAHGSALAASVERTRTGLSIRLDSPARGIAPGQAAVIYVADRVVASATISATVLSAHRALSRVDA